MWRHQFMLASFGLLLVLPAVAWAAPSDGKSVVSQAKNDLPRGMTPQESLSTLRVPPGFKVEITACEPLVQDPIALDWGADGKLWVVEMGDYPLGVDGKGKPGGIVRFLEDTNGDGVYDKATTFLDGLPFPTGVMPWRSGVLVAAAPDIFYAVDRDGDGKADHRELLFTGLARGTSSTASTASTSGSTVGSTGQTATAAARFARSRRARSSTSRAATSGSSPTRASSRPRVARRNTVGIATTGATGSATTTRSGAGTTYSVSRT